MWTLSLARLWNIQRNLILSIYNLGAVIAQDMLHHPRNPDVVLLREGTAAGKDLECQRIDDNEIKTLGFHLLFEVREKFLVIPHRHFHQLFALVFRGERHVFEHPHRNKMPLGDEQDLAALSIHLVHALLQVYQYRLTPP